MASPPPSFAFCLRSVELGGNERGRKQVQMTPYHAHRRRRRRRTRRYLDDGARRARLVRGGGGERSEKCSCSGKRVKKMCARFQTTIETGGRRRRRRRKRRRRRLSEEQTTQSHARRAAEQRVRRRKGSEVAKSHKRWCGVIHWSTVQSGSATNEKSSSWIERDVLKVPVTAAAAEERGERLRVNDFI